jgi:photosystem II stability/assembly factor-like uncharacterized protein
MGSRLRQLALAGSTVLLATATAAANGRFPTTVNVHAGAGDDRSIYLAATFGLLISHDDGAHFRWVCEQAIGYGGTFDPKYRVAADGTIFATTFDGLRISRDRGCTWELAGPPIADIWIDAIDLGPDGSVWVATSQGGMSNDVFVSRNNGKSFHSVGLLDERAWWKSIAVAPSTERRVYVAGYSLSEEPIGGDDTAPGVIIERSDDGGATWRRMPVDDIAFAQSPGLLIEGVLPGDPDVVFARSIGANPPAGDQLYRSADGGESWQMVLETEDRIQAFAIRADGSVIAGTIDDGTWIAPAGGAVFARPTQQPEMACVTERSDGALFACGANWKPDFFALGRSSDGQTWDKVVRFSEIAGPVSCPVGTVQRDICEGKLWPGLAEQFGIGRVDAGPTPDAGGGGGGGDGCCDGGAGAGGAPLAVVIAVLGAGLLRRGRRQRTRLH